MHCKVCGSQNLVRLNTYKHYWYTCQECQSAERKKKEHYALEKFFPTRLSGKLPGYFTYILPSNYFDESKLGTSYNYYADMGGSNEGSGTKWDGETQLVVDRLKKFNIDLKGKNVLDVSGGPGFVANNLKGITHYILLTEFSETAVEGMRKFLSVDVKKYDYNSDDLSKISADKFDVILVRFSINFCNDIRKFATEAKTLLKPGGLLYIEHVEPNRGSLLRWQFDEYTYTLLHGIKIFAKIFEESGFETVRQEVLFEEAYNKPYWNYSSFKIKVFYFFIRRLRDSYKMRMKGTINKNLNQQSWVSIFKLK